MNDKETFALWDVYGKMIDAKLYPFRWYLFFGVVVLAVWVAI